MQQITYPEFEKIEIRTGTILKAELFPEARKPAYKLLIDFGPFGTKRSSAQVTDYYQPEELTGIQVVAVMNFPAKQVANFISECLVLGAVEDDGKVILLRSERKVIDGLRIL